MQEGRTITPFRTAMRKKQVLQKPAFLILLFLRIALTNAIAAAAPDFMSEVKPIFEHHCVKCHGPEKQKGGLRFDAREGAFKTADSGEKAVVPGHAGQSRLLKLVSSRDKEE